MSTILNELRELTKKFPNLAEQVVEASKPVEKPLSDVAYVYNGYEDVNLLYLGAYRYNLKAGHVTRIDSLPNHREVDTDRTKGSSKLQFMVIPLKGEFIAKEVIERRNFGKRGIVVFTDEGGKDDPIIDGVRIPEKLKADADAAGYQFKLQAIESFIIGRDKAKAGIPGNKMRADGHIFEWMKKFRSDDEMFAERHAKTDSNALMAAAVEKIAAIAEFLKEKTDTPGMPPRRKPMEGDESYKARVAEWAMGTDEPKKGK